MEHSITILAESMNEVQVQITSKSHFMNAYLREESDFTSTFKKPCVNSSYSSSTMCSEHSKQESL